MTQQADGILRTIAQELNISQEDLSCPCHFHNGSKPEVSENHISEVPEETLREFLLFVWDRMGTSSS